jgi:hypothetical protein
MDSHQSFVILLTFAELTKSVDRAIGKIYVLYILPKNSAQTLKGCFKSISLFLFSVDIFC